MKNLIKSFLILISIFLCFQSSCSGGKGTETGNPNEGLNGATIVQGVVFSKGTALAVNATVYISGEPVSTMSLSSNKMLQADCGTQGGVVSCEDPPESACAQTCSCADGSYVLDTSACPTDAETIKFCEGGTCQAQALSCPGGATCDLVLNNPCSNSDVVDELICFICGRYLQCHGVPFPQCAVDLESIFIDDQVGLPENQFTMSQIRAGLNDGSFILNPSVLPGCEASIATGSCNLILPTVDGAAENIVGEPCDGNDGGPALFTEVNP